MKKSQNCTHTHIKSESSHTVSLCVVIHLLPIEICHTLQVLWCHVLYLYHTYIGAHYVCILYVVPIQLIIEYNWIIRNVIESKQIY